METPSENKPRTPEEELEWLGSLFFTRKKIEIITGDSEDLILKGRLKSEAELRESVMTLAKSGSGPAQAMANQYITNMKINEAADY
jgi:hypothetical protein